ncbi:MAG TPA: copper chaperone PCu(A)C [Hyphomicrobiales bacterium]|nr:copper chaperone PCu(A)C [Rhodobiaceae bacterium]HXK53928.1 copper chaperone PCu(A)C [Hyphomicrobiales bacterium]
MKILYAAAAAIAALIAVSAPGLHAEGMKAGPLELSDAWARASSGHEGNGAAYVTIANHGGEADRLIGAKSDIAEKTEIHNNLMEDGIMKMRRVESIDLLPGESARLQPGGYHIMFIGLHKPLEDGASFPLTLVFEKGGEVALEVPVKKIGAGGAMKMNH